MCSVSCLYLNFCFWPAPYIINSNYSAIIWLCMTAERRFTSCLINYITNLALETEWVIVIYDGCDHQNRNRVLSNASSDLSQRMKLSIEQLNLEKGAMMQVDSVHSTIKQYIYPLFTHSDYVARMQQAPQGTLTMANQSSMTTFSITRNLNQTSSPV